MPFTEASFENAILEIFRDHLGYQTLYGPEFDRDYRHPFIEHYLKQGIQAANPGLHEAALQEALYRLRSLEGGSLVQRNERFMDWLQNGIEGSGKSLSMVFYARLLQEALNGPTIVVMTDRNDLDNQLFTQFARCRDFLRQTPQQAESRANLKELLEGRTANGIIFTTMQKFEEQDEPLSLRRNLVIIADEAHRGQYGLEDRVDPQTGKVSHGTARVIRDNLPHATFIGFTGTPIELRDHNTREIFGNYIDIYDMTQSVEDGATRPVYYESRVIHLKLEEKILWEIDKAYDEMLGRARFEDIQRSKRDLSQLESILGAPETIQALCEDIVKHYEDFRQHELTGKAMIVAYSRRIAIDIHRKLLELRPAWKDKVRPVITGSNDDPEDWHEYTGNKQDRAELARRFKDPDDPFKIAIVVDMWLTGFDVPSLATMYVYKPMQGHNLMQAIARVNRVYKDKEGGLVVDYIGIARALKEAMNNYTGRDQFRYGDMDIASTAYLKFLEKLEVCEVLFHPFDYSSFFTGTDLDRAHAITDGTNFLTDARNTEKKEVYLNEAQLLKQAYSLCKSLATEPQRLKAAYFETVRTLLTRIARPGLISPREINERINELLKQSIKSEGVINLFTDVKEEFSIFDPKFLEEIARMRGKNLAVELLRKLISEQVRRYKGTNLVKSDKFSEMLQKTMTSYLNGMISNEEVIQELLRLAEQIAADRKQGEDMGVTEEEMAFYDALTRPEAIKDFYENEELIAIAKELTDTLRKSRTIDWQKKETARAKMRLMVKRLLRKHRYPPDGLEIAVSTVIQQCELWADSEVA